MRGLFRLGLSQLLEGALDAHPKLVALLASQPSLRAGRGELIPKALDLVLKLTHSRVGASCRRLDVSELQAQAFDCHFKRAPL